MEVAARRPQRWDVPLDDGMRPVDVDHLLEIEPFRSIDPAEFPPSLALRDILQNDARIVRAQPGDILVREGDYGSSAFCILGGRVRVVLSGLPEEALGRELPQKQSWIQTLLSVLRQPPLPEMRETPPSKGGARGGNHESSTAQRLEAGGRRVFLQDIPRILETTNTVTLAAGEMFGELAALTRSPRRATVFAETEAVLVEIRWQGLRDIMRRTDALRRHVEKLYRENSLRVHLRETPLLANLPPEQLEAVAAATVFEAHGEFDWHASYEAAVKRGPEDALIDEPLIAEEGTPADGLILIRTGFARESQRFGAGHRTLAYLGRGQAFGLAEAIESAARGEPVPWNHSLRALGYVDVLRIPLATLAEHVCPYISKGELAHVVQLRDAVAPQTHTSLPWPLPSGEEEAEEVEQGLLDFLVDRRLINGRETMVINLDRCTRCDDCVRACAATHDNNPRFTRQGLRHGPLLFAQACMHCVDPVCMIGCPTGAIGRDATTGVVRINDQTCIGCSTCANSCPYDNITMVEIRDRRGALVTDAETGQPIAKATKCDLCTDLPGGPACQRACPHDALVRVDLGNLGELSAWVGR